MDGFTGEGLTGHTGLAVVSKQVESKGCQEREVRVEQKRWPGPSPECCLYLELRSRGAGRPGEKGRRGGGKEGNAEGVEGVAMRAESC